MGGHLVHRQHRSLWSSRLWDDEDEEDLASPRLDRQRLRRCCRRSQLYHQLCQPVLVCVSDYIFIASCTMTLDEIQVKCFFSGFRAIWIGMIAGITAYYAIGLKNVYDDMSDAPAAGFSIVHVHDCLFV